MARAVAAFAVVFLAYVESPFARVGSVAVPAAAEEARSATLDDDDLAQVAGGDLPDGDAAAVAGDDDPDHVDSADAAAGAVEAAAAPAAARCRGRYCYDATDVLAVFATVGPRTQCVMRREMGPRLDPNAIGRAGEIGPIQLHPQGKLAEYLATGRDPWNPYDAGPWLQAQLLAGEGRHWSPVRLGLC